MTVEEGYKNESGLVQTGLVPAASILPVLTPRNGNSFEKNGHGLVEVELDFPVNVKSGRKVTPPKTLPHDFCLKDVLRFLATPRAEVDGHIVKIILPFCINLDQELMDNVSFFVRWGSYDDIPERWRDVKVRPRELTKDEAGHYSLCKELRVYKRGRYGATVYATTAGENAEKVWQGRADLDDAKFNIESDSVSYVGRLMRVRRLYRSEVEKLVRARLTDWEESDFSMDGVRLTPTLSRLSRVIFDCSRTSTKWRGLLSKYYQEAVRKLQAEQTDELKSSTAFVVNLLGNIGLGDVIMVAPEGPHASAGGLAQVMNGLMTSLPSHGVPVTLISPLYEHEQGNIHKSADQILREGIHFNGQTMELKWVGEIDVPFGPTYQRGTQHHRDQAHLARSVVYQAELGNVRMLLIRNSRYADYLYSAVRADEQLRRAIFISRAALEVLRNPIFGLHPQLILSNDWVTALVPVFHKLDLRYSCADNLRDSKTLHLLHNCGRDYHGCIPFTFDNKDLWPMLELDPLHAYGMRDPQNPAMINLTAGAIFHLNGALLAVSKPYAQQLLTLDGGGGLDKLVENRRKAVFGISNGIDQKSLRSTIVKIGGKNLAKLDLPQPPAPNGCVNTFVSQLPTYKSATKAVLQRDLGLDQDPQRILISFVGRLAEQKGLQLLTGFAAGDGVSVMESILLRYPQVQFVVAGPQVDSLSRQFRGLVEYLCWKHRGRVAGIYNFIPHEYALEIFTASDFYLMPSRFEPGGLTQLEALSCGSLVIARNVGGLSATLCHVDDPSGKGNSFLFNDYTTTALRDTICWAIDSTRDEKYRRKLINRAARCEHDWENRVPQYVALFQHIAGVLDGEHPYDHLSKRVPILECLRP